MNIPFFFTLSCSLGPSPLPGVSDVALCCLSLVESGQASVDAEDSDKRTPLHWACVKGRDDIAEFLISKGAAVDHKDDSGTALAFVFVSETVSRKRIDEF